LLHRAIAISAVCAIARSYGLRTLLKDLANLCCYYRYQPKLQTSSRQHNLWICDKTCWTVICTKDHRNAYWLANSRDLEIRD
jgi:hypothetical protein